MALSAAALTEALARNGTPEIFNTVQGSHITVLSFIRIPADAGIRISMDGRGRWTDNLFIEHLGRSLKHECVCLQAFDTSLTLHARRPSSE